MKIKRLFSIVALGLFGVVSAAAGLSMRKEAEPAKADAPNTWMFRAQLNLGSCSPHSPDCVFPEDKPVDGVKFHIWGTNVNNWYDATYLCYDTFDFYGLNIALRDDQTIDGAQWVMHQVGEGDKYSIDITDFGADAHAESIDKNSDFTILQWQFNNIWTGESKWGFHEPYGYQSEEIYLTYSGNSSMFDKDPANNRFIIENLALTTSDYVGADVVGSGINFELMFRLLLDEESMEKYAPSGTNNWWYMAENGSFDFIVGDKVSIKKHEEKQETYIYYVTNSAAATTDYIYSWGGSEQFGSFPGTSIASLVAAEKAEEVTGNGVLHFQGSETPKLIYKINIDMGYPVGDSMFMFNNGTSEYKSDERAIAAENVYWWTGPANINAKWGLEFLITVEAYRNSKEDYSVCNIDADSAKFLVNAYNSLPEDSRVTYVDTTTVYTWTDSTKTAEGLISYRQVMIQLGKIGGVAPVGSSLSDVPAFYNDTASNNAAIAIIIITSCLAITAVGVLLIVKKKRHN